MISAANRWGTTASLPSWHQCGHSQDGVTPTSLDTPARKSNATIEFSANWDQEIVTACSTKTGGARSWRSCSLLLTDLFNRLGGGVVSEIHQITLASTCYLSCREMELRDLRESLSSYAETAWPQELLLDCRHVQEAGAAFLGIVAESAGRFSHAGRSLRLINVNDWIRELVQHCRLNQLVAPEKSRRERSAVEPMGDQCCVQRGPATCRSCTEA